MAEQAERTEPATPKRRADARERGDVAQSREVASVFVLGAVFLGALSALGPALVQRVAAQAQAAWSGAEVLPETLADFHALLIHHLSVSAWGLLPLLGLIMLAGSLASISQIGLLFSSKALAFNWKRFDLVEGLKRLVNADKLVELLKAFVKIGLITGAVWWAVGSSLSHVFVLPDSGVFEGLELGADLVRRLLIVSLVVLSLLAILDIAWVRYRHARKLRMTRQEVRDEMRQREGSPQTRSRIRQMQRELTRQRMIAEVATADVVVTNPTHYAVALRYAQGQMKAPRLVAKGRNYVALRIRRAAEENGIPVVENPPLAQVLYRTVKVGREIPESLFQAVAEILAWVYRVDPRRGSAWRTA